MTRRLSRRNSQPARLRFCGPDAERTGPSRYLLHLLRWLRANRDVELEVVLGSGGPLVEDMAAVADLSVLAEPVPGTPRRRSPPIDLVYLNAVAAARAFRQLPRSRVPVIGHVHELSAGLEHWAGPGDLDVIRSSSRVLAVSRAVIDELVQRHGFDRAAVGLLPGFVWGEPLPPDARARARRSLAIPDSEVVIGSSGTLDWRKAPDLFLRTIDSLQRAATGPPVHGLWVGGGSTSPMSDSFRHHRARTAHPDRVHLVESTDQPLSWFAAMDVFVLTAREDALPLVCLEAASLGIPIVCFDNGGAGDLVQAARCGATVSYPDITRFVAEIQRLVDHVELRRACGDRGARVVAEHFTIDVVGPQVWHEINALIRS